MSSAVENLLSHLECVRRSGDGWVARCPAHEDRVASLSVAAGNEGRVLVQCFAGCEPESIVAGLNLTMADLFEPNGNGKGGVPPARRATGAFRGEPVDAYAHALLNEGRILARLDELRGWTPAACKRLGVGFDGTRVVFPYRDATGALVGVGRYQPNLEMRNGIPKVSVALGSHRDLFPPPETLNAGVPVWLVEGEPDAVRATSLGLGAVAIPGVQGWKREWAARLAGRQVVICMDCDAAGRDAARRIAADIAGAGIDVRVLDLDPDRDDGYDLTDFTAAARTDDDRSSAARLLSACAERLSPVQRQSDTSDNPTSTLEPASPQGSGCRMDDPTTIRQRPALACERDILSLFERDLRELGVAGEERIAKVTYLALVSRLLPWGKASNRPVSVITKGTSSSGKSYVTTAAMEFMPEDTVLTLTSSSRLFLLYSERSLHHRFVYIPEWSAIAEQEELVTLLRVLVSEGHVEHGTVEGAGRKEARELRKEGPTGLLMTTTAAITDAELETRCLALRTDDSPEQTRRIFTAIADLETSAGAQIDLEPWHELQLWLEQQDNRVLVPYVRQLAQLMPTSATRLRRDFVSMLCLVRAHAILHQATRDRDDRDRVVATLDDYDAVRALIGDLVAEGADAFVSEAIRETVDAVGSIVESGAEHATSTAVVQRLGIGRGAALDRIKRALHDGYLVNIAEANARVRKLRPGQPLPDEPEFLPSRADVEALVGSMSDGSSDRTNGSTISDRRSLSDSRRVSEPPPIAELGTLPFGELERRDMAGEL